MFAWFRRLWGGTGLQPNKRPKRIIPPSGGSGGFRPQGKPVDLNTVTPPPIASVVTPADVRAMQAELARLVKLLEYGAHKGESHE